MRRIPRPQRAIDVALPPLGIPRYARSCAACLRPAPSSVRLRTAAAPFSTTPVSSFLVSGKQDKKKHQQFVRRWQKRLLGDSEPIGAHVDPYDPTSPVRIAPEEQGEEVEVLEDQTLLESTGPLYKEAAEGQSLRHVGSKAWIEQQEERNLAEEYERLTGRTYTPLSLKMANEIETLTNTPYTLRDNNLMMGQTFEEATNKPYTDWSFGPWTRARSLKDLRRSFHQAVVEVYALKQAGHDLDMSASANRGVYDTPEWIWDVKLQRTEGGHFALAFPEHHNLNVLLEEILGVPEYTPELSDPREEEVILNKPPEPVMDSNITPARRGALVKQDPDKKPFDFMSNRPVPRAKPVLQPVETLAKEPPQQAKTASPLAPSELEAASEASRAAIMEMHTAILETSARSAEENVAALLQAVRDSVTAQASTKTIEVPVSNAEAKWRHVPITGLDIKFAVTKRLAQLTGLYIPDLQLTSATTLGDLYHHLCEAAKPKPHKLFSFINTEGAWQNQRAKRLAQTDKAASQSASRKKPGVGELLRLKNVQLMSKKPNAVEERRKVGLQKVIARELQSRGLVEGKAGTPRTVPGIIEGTRRAPELGVPIPRAAADALKNRTQEKFKELENRGIGIYAMDDVVRSRNTPPRWEAASESRTF